MALYLVKNLTTDQLTLTDIDCNQIDIPSKGNLVVEERFVTCFPPDVSKASVTPYVPSIAALPYSKPSRQHVSADDLVGAVIIEPTAPVVTSRAYYDPFEVYTAISLDVDVTLWVTPDKDYYYCNPDIPIDGDFSISGVVTADMLGGHPRYILWNGNGKTQGFSLSVTGDGKFAALCKGASVITKSKMVNGTPKIFRMTWNESQQRLGLSIDEDAELSVRKIGKIKSLASSDLYLGTDDTLTFGLRGGKLGEIIAVNADINASSKAMLSAYINQRMRQYLDSSAM